MNEADDVTLFIIVICVTNSCNSVVRKGIKGNNDVDVERSCEEWRICIYV